MPVNIAVIGVGHMGRIHADKLGRMEDVRLAAVIDCDEERAKPMASAWGAPYCRDHAGMDIQVDAVVIATPTETHFSLAKFFLERSIHVFMEKPITTRPEEAEELIELASKGNLVLQIGHLERFNPAFVAARRSIDDPRFIEAERISPFTGRSTDIDVVLDMMVHDIDLTLSLVNDRVSGVRAVGAPAVSDKVDMANAWIEFEHGAVAHLKASRVATKRQRTLRIFQRDAYFSLDLAAGRMSRTTRSASGDLVREEFQAEQMDAVRDELAAFTRAVRQSREPVVTGRDGLEALTVANLIRKRIEEYIAETRARG